MPVGWFGEQSKLHQFYTEIPSQIRLVLVEDQGLKQAFAAGEMEDGEGIHQILQAFLEKTSHICGILGKVLVQNNLYGFASYRTG